LKVLTEFLCFFILSLQGTVATLAATVELLIPSMVETLNLNNLAHRNEQESEKNSTNVVDHHAHSRVFRDRFCG